MKKTTILTITAMIMVAVISVFLTLTAVNIFNTWEEKRDQSVYIKLDPSVSPALIYKFNEVTQRLKDDYIGEVDDNTLLEGAIAGLAMSLGDPYTLYVPKDIMQLMQEKSDGRYSGIGVTITLPKEGVGTLVLIVNEDGPANASGMVPGDRIVKIDGVDVSNEENLEYIASLVKGEVGTAVSITVYRESVKDFITFTIKRAIINTINVAGRMEMEDIGYIRIYSFSQDSHTEFARIFNELVDMGMRRLVIDVRDNPGGSLTAIIRIADMFISEGLITYTIDRNEKKTEYYARKSGVDLPIVLLINENSASASEMLAGALKDNGIATVVGVNSYGKGLVQGVYTLSDGSGLRVTIARYYTPSGISIDGDGIEPNETVLSLEEYLGSPLALIPREKDVQLDRALEILLNR
ncbi:MAG: S41 family peptidase [Clostridia bacterium]